MGFFDEIIDPAWLRPTASALPDPPWVGPPHDVMPAPVVMEMEFVRMGDLAVWMSGAAVFPCGVSFELQVRWGDGRRVQLPLVPGERGRDGLCLGALFDDGHRELAVPRRRQSTERAPSQSLVAAPLRVRPHQATSEIWLWPLPEISLTWILEWRAQRVGESRVRTEASEFTAAARNARPVWAARRAAAV
jgi:hypothetical protein